LIIIRNNKNKKSKINKISKISKINNMIKKNVIKKNSKIKSVEEKIKEIIEQIRPSLQMDGGDVFFVNFDEKSGILKVELMGHCMHCPMSQITLKQGIEAKIKKLIPQVKEVKAI